MKFYIIRNNERYDLALKPKNGWEIVKEYDIDEKYFTPAMINLAQIVSSLNKSSGKVKYPIHF